MRTTKLLLVPLVLVLLIFAPVGSALAVSTASGNLALTVGIDYTSGSLEWIYGPTSLETWTIGQIYNNEAGTLAQDNHPIYDYNFVPGWNTVPDPIVVSASGGSATINNYTNLSVFTPGGESAVEATAGVILPQIDAIAYISYFANFHALTDGEFTFFVDYSGTWGGSTGGVGDQALLRRDLQGRVDALIPNTNNGLDYGDTLASFSAQNDKWLKDGEDGGFTDVSGHAFLTFDFLKGDYFTLRFDGANIVSVQSEVPVPEPATMLLLGLGLIGLVGARKKFRK